jgi:hypothetical protein
MANSIVTEKDLRRVIEDIISPETCFEIVSIIYSATGKFSNDVFIESDIFFDDILGNVDPFEIARSFYAGRDLDKGKEHANPNAEYFRLNKRDDVESTDYPGDIYYEELTDDIIDFIMDNLEDYEYPDDIQEVIDEYLKNSEV